MTSDEELTRALSVAGRVDIGERTRSVLDDLVLAVARSDVRSSLRERKSRKAWIIVPTVLAIVGLPVGAVAVGSWNANTGIFGGTGTEVVDRSEWIGLDAEDAPQVIVDLYDDSLALPPGATRDDVIEPIAAVYTDTDPDSGHVLMQASTIKWSFERAARCLWYREWLDADTHNDATRRDAAAAGLLDAATWPQTVQADGGGVVDFLKHAAASAAEGDRREVLDAYGKCSIYYGEVSE